MRKGVALKHVPMTDDAIKKILDKEDKALDAGELAKRIPGRPDLSTVYRALKRLEMSGRVNSVTFFRAKKHYYSGKKNGHFLVCQDCHEIITFNRCPSSVLEKELKEAFSYMILSHKLLFRGLCPTCARARAKRERQKS